MNDNKVLSTSKYGAINSLNQSSDYTQVKLASKLECSNINSPFSKFPHQVASLRSFQETKTAPEQISVIDLRKFMSQAPSSRLESVESMNQEQRSIYLLNRSKSRTRTDLTSHFEKINNIRLKNNKSYSANKYTTSTESNNEEKSLFQIVQNGRNYGPHLNKKYSKAIQENKAKSASITIFRRTKGI